VVRPSQRKEMAKQYVKESNITIKLACKAFCISETCFRYRPKLSTENEIIADWLLRLTTTYRRWGFGLCYLHLRNVKHFPWNHKRVYRIYRELELNLRIKPKRRVKREKPDALSVPIQPNKVWSMDFMSDNLVSGKSFRTFNVIDDFNRECLGLEVDFSLPSERVIRSLSQIIEWRGKPERLRCDNGPEYLSENLKKWCRSQGIILDYIQKGKPTQNAYVERFNRTVRHEWLELNLFETIHHAQELATKWMWTYNNERPNSAIGGIPPRMKTSVA
jgi:putative transposase